MSLSEDEIINRINKFLDKEKLDLRSKYFLAKQLQENYWQDIQSEGEEEEPEEVDVLEDELEEEPEEEIEETTEELPEDELDDLDNPPAKPKKKALIKKPKVKLKR
jgi:hypothetical protein